MSPRAAYASLLVLAALTLPGARPAEVAPRVALAVPIVVQERERCGPAALEMVMRFYGAADTALREAGRAYDPALRGALITDLAAAARRAGFATDVGALTPDSLVALLGAGVPPIVLYQAGPAPLTTRHYGVVTAWDPARGAFILHTGEARPRAMRREEFEQRWRTAGSQALLVRRRSP
jgi:ABC-type bacteriocin/lantibiotic exporter with double-glycine peptidase domain